MAKIESSVDFLTSIEKEDFESINTYIKESGDDSKLARWFASSFLECNDTTNWFAFLKNLVTSEIKTEKKSVLFNLFARNVVRYFALKLDNYDETRLTELIRYITTLTFFQSSDNEDLYECIAKTNFDEDLEWLQELKSTILLDTNIKTKIENQLLTKHLKRLCEDKDFIELFKLIDKIGMDRAINILEENPNLITNSISIEVSELLKIYRFQNLNSPELVSSSNKISEKFEMVNNVFLEIRRGLTSNSQLEFMNGLRGLNRYEMNLFFGFFNLMSESSLYKDFGMIKGFFQNAKEEIAKLNKLIEAKDFRAFLIINLIKPFILGLGQLGYKEGLLTCAQVATRKSQTDTYEFNPTVIYAGEVKKYFEILKNCGSHSDHRERVIIVGIHWLTCDIQIKNGEISTLVIEPLGTDVRHETTNPVLKEIAEILPNTPIFFSNDKRQDSGPSCQVFALDDIMHLFTLEIYLPEKDLFKYFVNQNQQVKSIEVGPGESVNIIPVELPLSLMRTMRSRILINEGGVIDTRQQENKLLINKKEHTALQSALLFFKPKENGMLINQRLEEKLVKIAHHNLTYLVDTPLEDIARAMQKYTLAGFEQRLKEIQNQLEQQITDQTFSRNSK